ncbi:MAG: hypothetical protein ACRDT8_15870 [Micromonosporaceae bacterium]
MNITTHALALVLGIGLGAAAGWRTQQAVRAWVDYRAAKKQLPVLLAAARKLTRHAAGVLIGAAVVAALALYLAT